MSKKPHLVCRQGVRGEYLSIEYDPYPERPGNPPRMPEVWRVELPEGMTLKRARELHAQGMRPKPRANFDGSGPQQQLLPSLNLPKREDRNIFNDDGNFLPGYRASKQIQEQLPSFTPEGLEIVRTRGPRRVR